MDGEEGSGRNEAGNKQKFMVLCVNGYGKDFKVMLIIAMNKDKKPVQCSVIPGAHREVLEEAETYVGPDNLTLVGSFPDLEENKKIKKDTALYISRYCRDATAEELEGVDLSEARAPQWMTEKEAKKQIKPSQRKMLDAGIKAGKK
uniref:Nudix hydrolase domain-containing protein n=1 Tax=Ditylenchus dipsaci TaxID=166011 RepID=A0A915CPX5_9BILA